MQQIINFVDVLPFGLKEDSLFFFVFFRKLLELFYLKVVTGNSISADMSRIVNNAMLFNFNKCHEMSPRTLA